MFRCCLGGGGGTSVDSHHQPQQQQALLGKRTTKAVNEPPAGEAAPVLTITAASPAGTQSMVHQTASTSHAAQPQPQKSSSVNFGRPTLVDSGGLDPVGSPSTAASVAAQESTGLSAGVLTLSTKDAPTPGLHPPPSTDAKLHQSKAPTVILAAVPLEDLHTESWPDSTQGNQMGHTGDLCNRVLQPVYINSSAMEYFRISCPQDYTPILQQHLVNDSLLLPLMRDAVQASSRQLYALQQACTPSLHTTLNPVSDDLSTVRVSPCLWRDGQGGLNSAVMLEHNLPVSRDQVTTRVLRDFAILSQVSTMLTLLDYSGKVLFQNAGSVKYWGNLLGIDPSTLPTPEEPRMHGHEPPSPNVHIEGLDERQSMERGGSQVAEEQKAPGLLAHLLHLEPTKVGAMLQCIREDTLWNTVLEVHASGRMDQYLVDTQTSDGMAASVPTFNASAVPLATSTSNGGSLQTSQRNPGWRKMLHRGLRRVIEGPGGSGGADSGHGRGDSSGAGGSGSTSSSGAVAVPAMAMSPAHSKLAAAVGAVATRRFTQSTGAFTSGETGLGVGHSTEMSIVMVSQGRLDGGGAHVELEVAAGGTSMPSGRLDQDPIMASGAGGTGTPTTARANAEMDLEAALQATGWSISNVKAKGRLNSRSSISRTTRNRVMSIVAHTGADASANAVSSNNNVTSPPSGDLFRREPAAPWSQRYPVSTSFVHSNVTWQSGNRPVSQPHDGMRVSVGHVGPEAQNMPSHAAITAALAARANGMTTDDTPAGNSGDTGSSLMSDHRSSAAADASGANAVMNSRVRQLQGMASSELNAPWQNAPLARIMEISNQQQQQQVASMTNRLMAQQTGLRNLLASRLEGAAGGSPGPSGSATATATTISNTTATSATGSCTNSGRYTVSRCSPMAVAASAQQLLTELSSTPSNGGDSGGPSTAAGPLMAATLRMPSVASVLQSVAEVNEGNKRGTSTPLNEMSWRTAVVVDNSPDKLMASGTEDALNTNTNPSTDPTDPGGQGGGNSLILPSTDTSRAAAPWDSSGTPHRLSQQGRAAAAINASGGAGMFDPTAHSNMIGDAAQLLGGSQGMLQAAVREGRAGAEEQDSRASNLVANSPSACSDAMMSARPSGLVGGAAGGMGMGSFILAEHTDANAVRMLMAAVGSPATPRQQLGAGLKQLQCGNSVGGVGGAASADAVRPEDAAGQGQHSGSAAVEVLPSALGEAPALQARPYRWHEVHLKPIFDPVTKEKVLLLKQMDVTARVEVERKLAHIMGAQTDMLSEMFPRHVLEMLAQAGEAEALCINSATAGSGSNSTALPSKPVACDLTPHVSKLAHDHPMVTILFTDIVGFTSMSKELEASQVMLFLSTLFSLMDNLVDKHDVYKVETAGDCFIVAGGLMRWDEDGFMTLDMPTPADAAEEDFEEKMEARWAEAARHVYSFAKDIQAQCSSVIMPHDHSPVRLRVGLHSGPLVSGVIGTKMPKFALFGDTMNTASRMESTCRPGCVQVSETTYRLLGHHVQTELEYTGGVEVKGKGRMDTYIWTPPHLKSGLHSGNSAGLAALLPPPAPMVPLSVLSGGGGPGSGSGSGPTGAIALEPSLQYLPQQLSSHGPRSNDYGMSNGPQSSTGKLLQAHLPLRLEPPISRITPSQRASMELMVVGNSVHYPSNDDGMQIRVRSDAPDSPGCGSDLSNERLRESRASIRHAPSSGLDSRLPHTPTKARVGVDPGSGSGSGGAQSPVAGPSKTPRSPRNQRRSSVGPGMGTGGAVGSWAAAAAAAMQPMLFNRESTFKWGCHVYGRDSDCSGSNFHLERMASSPLVDAQGDDDEGGGRGRRGGASGNSGLLPVVDAASICLLLPGSLGSMARVSRTGGAKPRRHSCLSVSSAVGKSSPPYGNTADVASGMSGEHGQIQAGPGSSRLGSKDLQGNAWSSSMANATGARLVGVHGNPVLSNRASAVAGGSKGEAAMQLQQQQQGGPWEAVVAAAATSSAAQLPPTAGPAVAAAAAAPGPAMQQAAASSAAPGQHHASPSATTQRPPSSQMQQHQAPASGSSVAAAATVSSRTTASRPLSHNDEAVAAAVAAGTPSQQGHCGGTRPVSDASSCGAGVQAAGCDRSSSKAGSGGGSSKPGGLFWEALGREVLQPALLASGSGRMRLAGGAGGSGGEPSNRRAGASRTDSRRNLAAAAAIATKAFGTAAAPPAGEHHGQHDTAGHPPLLPQQSQQQALEQQALHQRLQALAARAAGTGLHSPAPVSISKSSSSSGLAYMGAEGQQVLVAEGREGVAPAPRQLVASGSSEGSSGQELQVDPHGHGGLQGRTSPSNTAQSPGWQRMRRSSSLYVLAAMAAGTGVGGQSGGAGVSGGGVQIGQAGQGSQ